MDFNLAILLKKLLFLEQEYNLATQQLTITQSLLLHMFQLFRGNIYYTQWNLQSKQMACIGYRETVLYSEGIMHTKAPLNELSVLYAKGVFN